MTEILTHSVCNFLNFTLLFTLNGKDAPFVCVDVHYFTIKCLKLFFLSSLNNALWQGDCRTLDIRLVI